MWSQWRRRCDTCIGEAVTGDRAGIGTEWTETKPPAVAADTNCGHRAVSAVSSATLTGIPLR